MSSREFRCRGLLCPSCGTAERARVRARFGLPPEPPPDPASRCDGRPASSAAPARPAGGGAPRSPIFAGVFGPAGPLMEKRVRAWLEQADDGELTVLAARLSTLPLPVLLRLREHLADAVRAAAQREG